MTVSLRAECVRRFGRFVRRSGWPSQDFLGASAVPTGESGSTPVAPEMLRRYRGWDDE
jgi:hypothetical protein